MKAGKVYLVGAGCGDAELITQKGLRLLRQCDAVLYDDLAAKELLGETKADCTHIFVGKRYGAHSMPQAEINALLLEQARQGKTVVRLKGGDPFVFGRGGEEILALQAGNIPYEAVPGISSAIAVPMAAGIPVTHRKMARSFHVITGHTAENTPFPENLEILAKLEGTLVFLMGLHHLEEICAGLLAGGKDPKTPAALISKGTTPQQKIIRAPLDALAAAAQAAEAPAVIVIGAAAGLDFSATIEYPLSDVKIGVTGTSRITGKLKKMLAELGAAVTEMDYSRLLPYTENPALEAALEQPQDGTWAVFTSPNGVALFFDYLQRLRYDVRRLCGWKFAVIGTGTAAALERHGIYPAYQPMIYDVESLAAGLCEIAQPQERILILRAEQGSPVLNEMLDAAGLSYRDIKLYDIAVDAEKRRRALEMAGEMDFLTFASGSGVRGFFEDGGSIPAGTKAICIGSATQKMLERYGYTEAIVAESANAEGLIAAILKEVRK